MYVTGFTLEGFRWMDIRSNIKRIEVEARNQVQVIIGSNGSGKSSIFEQITPLPAFKGDYHRGGKKTITLFHQGVEYVLTSDFDTKTGKHSFLKNGKECNINGLSTLQADLCKEHLGYTSLIDNLIHCRYKVTEMGETERKALILSLSPSTPDFIIKLHKNAKSLLRSCKNNITMLQTRKAEIEAKLISFEEFDTILKDKDILDKEQIELANNIYLIQARLDEYKADLVKMGQVKIITEERMQQYAARLQNLLMGAGFYRRDSADGKFVEGITRGLSEYQIRLTEAVREYDKLASELEEYDTEVVNAASTESVNYAELLKEKTKLLEDLKPYAKFGRIPDDKLDLHQRSRDNLFELIDLFAVELEGHWDRIDKLSKLEQVEFKVHTKTTGLMLDIRNYRYQLTQHESRLEKMLLGPKTVMDNCRECDYMQQFHSELETTKLEVAKLRKLLAELVPAYERYARVNACLIKVVNKAKDQYKILSSFVEATRGTIWEVSYDGALAIMSGDRRGWLFNIDQTIQVQEKVRLLHMVEKEIVEVKMALEVEKKSSSPAIALLRKMYNEKRVRFGHLKDTVIDINLKVEELQKQLKLEQRIAGLKENGERLQKELVDWHDYVMLNEYAEYLADVLAKFTSDKAIVDKRIYELTKVIKEQENYKARYEEEIVKLLEKIEAKQTLYTYLEMGLSPESGMPRYHILQFINSILDNVNFILGNIWTAPLAVEKLDITSDVSCDFRVDCNGKSNTPFAKLSKSLKAVINFAFSIAMLHAVGCADYPIFFDECDEGFDNKHKQTYLEWLRGYMEASYSPQLWMVSHDAAMYSGFLYKDITCLHADNVIVPGEVNVHAKITR